MARIAQSSIRGGGWLWSSLWKTTRRNLSSCDSADTGTLLTREVARWTPLVSHLQTLKQRTPLAILGLSGGVDSAVAALILKRAGFEVAPVFMRCWDAAHQGDQGASSDDPWCASEAGALNSAENVARSLNLQPVVRLDLTSEYYHQVFRPMLDAYGRLGVTPNPDAAFCNPCVKFPALMECAQRYGADVIATGHYARVVNQLNHAEEPPHMLRAVDRVKDQSVFLCQLSAEGGSLPASWRKDGGGGGGESDAPRLAFPLGHLHKADVRRLAVEMGTPAVAACADRISSRGLCFVETTRNGAAYQQRAQLQQHRRARAEASLSYAKRESFGAFLARQLTDELAMDEGGARTVVVVDVDPCNSRVNLFDDQECSTVAAARRTAEERYAGCRVIEILRDDAARNAFSLTVGQRMRVASQPHAYYLVGRESVADGAVSIAYAVAGREHAALRSQKIALCRPIWLDGVGPALEGGLELDVVVRWRHGVPYDGIAARISSFGDDVNGISCSDSTSRGFAPSAAHFASAHARFSRGGIHMLLQAASSSECFDAVAPGQVVALYEHAGGDDVRILGGAEIAFPIL